MAGPLGQPTHIEKIGTVVCVGGGIGNAPLLPIATAMKSAGNKIISVLPSYGMKVMNLGKTSPTDSTYHLEDSNRSGGYQLDFRKDLKRTVLKINITRYEIK